MEAKDILKYLETLDSETALQVNGNTYTWEQVELAKKLSFDIAKELGFRPSKPKLSRRRAFIVILEELYYNVSDYPEDLTLDRIHKRASQRFEFAYRGLKNFNTPNEIHPKNPCLFYELDAYKKARYRKALSLIVQFSDSFFEVQEAAESLKSIYKEVLLC